MFQNAREVDTKRRKTFTTWFFPVGEEPLRIVTEYIEYLRTTLHWATTIRYFQRPKSALE